MPDDSGHQFHSNYVEEPNKGMPQVTQRGAVGPACIPARSRPETGLAARARVNRRGRLRDSYHFAVKRIKPDHYRDRVSSDSSSNLKTTGFLTTHNHEDTLIQKRRIPYFYQRKLLVISG
jgi:hypothetical protein